MTDEEKRDVARDEFDNCCCNYAIDLHEKVDALTKELDVATRESDEVIKILGALAPGGSIVNMAIAAHTAIGSLKEQRDAAKAENAKLENRHVQFMVEGGPVVMATDYDKLKVENDRLRAENERLCLPVANEEWPKTWEGHPRPSITRSAVNSLIASRWFSFEAGAERKGSDGSKETGH